ncbi:MAG: hypothetical protein AB8G22_20705 [Saprospiraceae bacterium]
MKYLLPLLALATLLTSLFLSSLFPAEMAQMPEGFQVPIIAYEFLQTETEVQQLFGAASPERQEWIEGMYLGHQWDTLYLMIYGAFLAAWGYYAAQQTKNNSFYAICVLALTASLGDVFENQQLVAILPKIDAGGFTAELDQLFIFTWIKWGALALALNALAFFTTRHFKLGKLHLVIGGVTLLLGIMAFFQRSVLTSYFTFGITLQFLLLMIMSVIIVWRNKKAMA